MFAIGNRVRVVKAKQAVWMIGKEAEVTERHSKTMVVIRFADGYRRVVRESSLEMVGACTCQDCPEYDMDGSRFGSQPCESCMRAYEEQQRQSDEWAKAGLCQCCGQSPATVAGVCETCMNAYCSAMAGVPYQD